MSYQSDDCVIVSMGCVLPGAKNTQEYWQNLINSRCSIKPISSDRWLKELNYSPYRELADKSYSHFGAEIDDSFFEELREKNFAGDKTISRLELMTTEAMNQAVMGIHRPSAERTALIVGAMNPDERYFITRFKTSLKELDAKLSLKYDQERISRVRQFVENFAKKLVKDVERNLNDILPTSVLSKIKKRFDIAGRSFIVDAACAAGVASIDIAMSYLKNYRYDMVFVGGMESNLGQGTYVLFSKVGALSETVCLPFDKRSRGLSQGEGSVIFAVQRYADAVAMGNPILGVVRAVGSSSDGMVASLFQPDHGGQILALKRAYEKSENQRVDYLELHGTGTQVGDFTESESAMTFFKNFEIPVGSVKSLIGHAKATAGAAGVLKCLLAIQNRQLPPSAYVEQSLFGNSDLFLNTKTVDLRNTAHTMKCGISSFGFGGTNFHLLLEGLEKNKPQIMEKQNKNLALTPVVSLGDIKLKYEIFDPQWFTERNSFYKVPPKSIPFIDKTQLLAVRATEQLLKGIQLPMTQFMKDQTHVISASSLGLDKLHDLIQRISLDTVVEAIKLDSVKGYSPEDVELMLDLADRILEIKEEYIPATEESGPGILNNVIAGRVCNAFNFRGKNLNIDCDEASESAALELIIQEIQAGKEGLFILIGVEEVVEAENYKVTRKSVSASAYCSVDFATRNFLKIDSLLECE